MRSISMSPRSVLILLFTGLLLTGCFCLAGSSSADAFGLFGFGRGGFGHPGMAPRLPAPRFGGGYPGRPPGWGGGPGRYAPPIVGGGAVVGGSVAGRAASGGGGSGGNHSNSSHNNSNNNGGNATPVAQNNLPYIADELITAFAPDTPQQAIAQFARRYDLTQIETQNFPLIGTSLYRWRVGGGRSVASVINAAGGENIVAGVQPNYIYTLQQAAAPQASAGDAAQYALGALQGDTAHQFATGKDVLVAVIDSEIDTAHPDLAATVVKSFDALTGSETPHLHGTEMAGAIAAHGKLSSIAPEAHILAAHAFDDSPGIARGNSFAIYKGLQWAADNGARIVNMSFAGPADPTLRRLIAAAYDKNIVLIAAAGNAGPQSEPLYPAADPNVIAVTATDSDGHVYKMANRGRYIAVAAPGVDIIALAPGGGYQLSTGTSIAAAHVSGIAALLLERKPSLKPADIRAILIATAKAPGPPTADADFGAGVVSAYRALTALNHTAGDDKGENAQAKQ